MKSRPKKESKRTVTHKGASDLQKLEREKRQKRREERRDQSRALQRGMATRVTEQERIIPNSGHDRQEEGMDEEESPMEEDLCIEKRESFQLEVPQEIRPLSPMNRSTRIQSIVEEVLILRAGEFDI